MAFRKTYDAIRDMVRRALLDVTMARDIVRKSGVMPGGAGGGGPDICGTFSFVNDPPEVDGLGYWSRMLGFGEPEFYFPNGVEIMSRYADLTGYTQARLLVTVTLAPDADSTMLVEVAGGSGARGFTDAPPTVSLAATGHYVSEWRAFAETPGAVLLRWIVSDPDTNGFSYAVGLCQLQVR